MLVGDVISATVPWAKENPVIAPHVLRLTRAVACCHVGFLTGRTKSPSSTISLGILSDWDLIGAGNCSCPAGSLASTRQRMEDGLDLRIAGITGVLEQDTDVIGGGRRSADHPFAVNVAHERRLA